MRLEEINRMIEVWENDKRGTKWIAEGLEFIIGSADKITEDKNTAEFRENMVRLFPKPIDRARVLKHITVSVCNEDPDDYEDGEKIQEAMFFIDEMLKAIEQAIAEKADLPDNYREIIAKLM